MKLLLLLSCLAATKAGATKLTKRHAPCEGPIINEVIHTKELLATDLDRPYLLTTDYATNVIYFSYVMNETDDTILIKTAKIDLNTKEFTDIVGVDDGYAQAVNPKTGDIYLGRNDGIYKYNRTSNTADELYSAKGKNIWMLFFKDVLYYSEFSRSKDVYIIEDGKISVFKDLEGKAVEFLVIDNEDNMFFANNTGLYRQKKGSKDVVYINGTNGLSFRAITTDLNDDVYVAVEDGIYVVNKSTNDLKLHIKVYYAYGVTFDNKNNMVYADDYSIYKLKPTTYSECI